MRPFRLPRRVPQSSDSRRFFNVVASEWEALRERMFGRPLLDGLLSALDARPGLRALDVGAGTGFVTSGLLEEGLVVTALDDSAAMREQLAARFAGRGVEIVPGDVEALEFPDGSFDRVAGNMFLHHVERPERAIAELARVLRPGGVLAIGDLDEHGSEEVRAAHHDRWMGFPRERVAAWLGAAGFEAVRLETAAEACRSDGCGGAQELGVFLASGRKPLVRNS